MPGSVVWEGHGADAWRQILGVPAVHLYETTGSTNDAARDLAAAGAPSLTVVIADHQTHGRGRGGRSWLSQPGSSLLCSVIFRWAGYPAAAPGAAPVRIGNAVASAISERAGVDARIKWPNDVVIPGHGKVAGILCEAVTRQGSAVVVAGIGVNFRTPGENYAALSAVSERQVARGELLRVLVPRLKAFADSLTQPLSQPELAQIRERDILLGNEVEDDTGVLGVARGIAADGSLIIQAGEELAAVHNATIRLAGTHEYPGTRI